MPATISRPQISDNRQTVPQPRAGESQASFAIRFHTAMQSRLPETDARNRACFAAWERHENGGQVAKIARRKFPEDKFVHVQAVPYFAEHVVESEGENGQPQKKRYDRKELARMVEANNDRACDVGLFAPIAEGHTPTEEQMVAGMPTPQVLGYSGCYRLGMIGNKKPRWCIFADEWHHKEDAEKLRRLSRRSVEVWEDGTIDPVAALGATTPRLDMGMTRFCRDSTGQKVRRYAAIPAANNCYVAGFGKRQSEPRRNAAGKKTMALQPEDLKQIIDALMDTEPMQYVISQMQASPERVEGEEESLAPEDDVEGMDEGMEGEEADLDGMVDGEEAEQNDAFGDDEMIDDMGDGPVDGPVMDDGPGDLASDEELAEMDEDERVEYDGMEDDQKTVYMKGRRRSKTSRPKVSHPTRLSRQASRGRKETKAEKYARTRSARDKANHYQRQINGLTQRLKEVETERRHADRYSKLQEKQSDGFVFELEEEFNEVKDVSEAEFSRHLKQVEKYQRVQLGGYMPTPDAPSARTGKQSEQYRRKRAELAVQLKQSKGISYEAALLEADTQLGG